MMYTSYMPFVRINESDEKQFCINKDLRIFFENHPNKHGNIFDFFDITLNQNDINTIKQLVKFNEEKNFFEELKEGDYIIIEPHIYVFSGKGNNYR